MGFASRGISSADILAAITSDSVKYKGADVVKKPIFRWNAIEHTGQTLHGTWATAVSSVRDLGIYYANVAAAAQNDEVGVGEFFIPTSGDYTVYMKGGAATNRARTYFKIDGVNAGFLEWYAGAADYNTIQSLSLGTITAGIHTLAIHVANRHASATDWVVEIQAFVIAKT